MAIDLKWLSLNFPELSNLCAIGEGGQKSVFVGSAGNNDRIVLKIFHPNSDVARVEREVEAVRLLNIPGVPAIYDLGIAKSPLGDVVWLKEQFINGQSLRARLSNGPMSADEVIALLERQLSILVAAENSRLVHRDVKPENILLDHCGESWLLDFGIVRHLDLESLTMTVAHWGLGTPGYAAPEQFRNNKYQIDGRTDLFALGVTIYECCEGINPFTHHARDVLEVIRRVETMQLPPIARKEPSLSRLVDMISTLTRMRRDQRPQSVKDAYAWFLELNN